jgi:hypothetical protein
VCKEVAAMTTIELRLMFLAGVILMAAVMVLAAGATLGLARWIGAVRPRLTACARQFGARMVQRRDTRSA